MTSDELPNVQCESCGGSGIATRGYWSGPDWAAPESDCDDCGGTGLVSDVRLQPLTTSTTVIEETMQELMTIASILGRCGQVMTLQIHQPTPTIRATVAALLERVPLSWRETPTIEHPTGVGYASIRVAANGYTINFVVHGIPRPRGWEPLPVHTWLEHELLAGEYLRGGIVAQILDDGATRPESLQ